MASCATEPPAKSPPPGAAAPDQKKILFSQLDGLLSDWSAARKKPDRLLTQIYETDLQQLVREHYVLILETLNRKEDPDRVVASAALGFLHDRRMIPTLLPLLQDADHRVVANAALSLGNLGDLSIPAAPLCHHFRHPQAGVRRAATYAVSRIITPDQEKGTLLPLLKAINDSDPAVRLNVIRSLAILQREEGARAILERALGASNEEVRLASIIALAQLKYEPALGPLIQCLKEGSEGVKMRAALALEEITGRKYGMDYDRWQQWWLLHKDKLRHG